MQNKKKGVFITQNTAQLISDLDCEEDDGVGDDWFQSNDLDQLFICVKDSLLTVCIRIISLVLHYHDQGCCHKKYYAPEEHKSYKEIITKHKNSCYQIELS